MTIEFEGLSAGEIRTPRNKAWPVLTEREEHLTVKFVEGVVMFNDMCSAFTGMSC